MSSAHDPWLVALACGFSFLSDEATRWHLVLGLSALVDPFDTANNGGAS